VLRTIPSRQLGCSQLVLKAQRKEFLTLLFNSTCVFIQTTADSVSEGPTFLRVPQSVGTVVLKSSEFTFVYW